MTSSRLLTLGPALARLFACVLMSLPLLIWPAAVGAAPGAQLGGRGTAAATVSYLRVSPGSGPFGAPVATAYVQAFDGADPPVGRTPIAGLPASAFSASVDGKPVPVTVRPVAPDEPVALIVVVDTNVGRGWLQPGAKYPDPLPYLRDATLHVLREFPSTNGRYAVYTQAAGAAGTPALADRTTAENAAQQLQAHADARLLEKLEVAVDTLKSAPPEWRRIVVVLSDGNSAFGRSYELVQSAAAQARVAVFAVGTIDANTPFRFLDRMAQETGGQAWLFDAPLLQPTASSPVLLDLLLDQAIKSIKSAYQLEYRPPSSQLAQRELTVTVKTPAGDLRTATTFRSPPTSGLPIGLMLLAGVLPLLAVAAAGGYYYLRLRPVKSDYFLVGHGPSAGHVPEHYLFTGWRALGRGAQGYPLRSDDPHFAGLSRTHVYLRVGGLRRIVAPGGQPQTVGTVEARAGKPSSGVGLNTAFVYNEITGVRPLSEKPFQLQSGDILILQPAARAGESANGLPAGVYLRLGKLGVTETEDGSAQKRDSQLTVVETPHDPNKTVVETVSFGSPKSNGDTGLPSAAASAPAAAPRPTPAVVSDRTQVGESVVAPPPIPPRSAAGRP